MPALTPAIVKNGSTKSNNNSVYVGASAQKNLQPVLRNQSLESLLFDDNYKRYMNAQTITKKDASTGGGAGRTLPVKKDRSSTTVNNKVAGVASTTLPTFSPPNLNSEP